MSAGWDYAQLTKRAAEYGGPEMFLENIKRASYAKGCIHGVLAGAGTACAVGVIACVAIKLKKHFDYVQEEGAKSEELLAAKMADVAPIDNVEDESTDKEA